MKTFVLQRNSDFKMDKLDHKRITSNVNIDIVPRIANNIRVVRESQNISIQELAYRCEMERSNMSRIESGRVNITVKTLYIISNALGVKLSRLVSE